MRTFILFISLFIGTLSFGQDNGTKTITINVKGNCEECKARIENAADIKGVKLATWEEKTQMLTVIYNADKVSALKIEQAIAATGHDAGNSKGNDSKYNKLPSCCKYRDKKCEK